jgi:hypothetical protein
MTYTEVFTEVSVIPGEVGGAVVGHDLIDGDVLPLEPGNSPLQEGQSGLAAFIRENLDVGEAGGVIHTDVGELVSEAGLGISAMAMNPVARASESSQFLGVDVEQLARPRALVPLRIGLRLEVAEPSEAKSLQDAADRGDGHPEQRRDPLGGPPPPPEVLDPADELARRAVRHTERSGRPIEETGPALGAEAFDPLGDRSDRDARGLRRFGLRPAVAQDAKDDDGTTVGRGLGVRMELHSGVLSRHR